MSDDPAPPDFLDGNGFRALTELAPDLVSVLDVDGTVRYVSPAIQRVMGYLAGDVLGRPFLEFVHPDDQRIGREDWRRLLASNEIFAPTNLRFRHKDGSFRTLETLMKSYSGAQEVKRVLVSSRDITQRVAREEVLRQAFAEVSDLYNNAPCGYHSLDENGVVVRMNDTELRWLGRTRDEVVGRMHFTELLASESLPVFERVFPVLKARGAVDNVEFELVRKDGTLLPVLLSATAATGEDGRFMMSRSTVYDITERKLAESALRKVNRALRTRNAVDSELIHAAEEAALLQNICRVCVELGGYRLAWVGFPLLDAEKAVVPVASFGFDEGYLAHADISWADDARGLGPTGAAIRTGMVQVNRDFLSDPRMAPWRADALRRGYRSSIALPLKDSPGPIGALMIYAAEPDAFDPEEIRLLEDVADDLVFGILTLRAREQHRQAEEKVEHLAYFDELTGLPNRNSLFAAVMESAEAVRADGAQFSLLVLNVIRFADIQSGIGVRQADELLRQLAARLQQAMQEGELLARIGGDEFAVLLRDGDAASARVCAQRIERALALPFVQAEIPISVQVRIGASIAPADGIEPEVLLLHAGVALRQAKKKGDPFVMYGGVSEAESTRHLVLITELRAAIEGKQLVLHYQPRIDLDNGRVAGVEALVRWMHPERGFIPPGDFIEIAEQTGLIRPLTYGVLDLALHQCNIWKAQGFAMPVSVNVSVSNFKDPEFLGRIEELLRSWNVGGELLRLEITESVLMEEPARVLAVLARLKESGILVSIDDFGTGYSSLSYVASLPIEALKIDRSFVFQMLGSARTRTVIAATIGLAQSLGISTVAEGVESREQAEALIAMGCNEIQGYFFCRPVEAETLRLWTDGFSMQAYGLGQGG